MKAVKIKNSEMEYPVGKIVCVGRNYAEHAKELGNEVSDKPVIFIKPASSLIFSGDEIIHPPYSSEMHHEVELVLLIRSEIKNADVITAENAVAGYAVGLDMTLRDIQKELRKKGDPWTIAKCFDTSAVVSDFILKSDYTITYDEEISLSVNDTIRQREKLSTMLFKPAEIVSYISSLMTLEKGDLIFTGTPAGVSKVVKGDRIFAQISNVGKLECRVA